MIELINNYWAVEEPKNAKYHRIDGVPNGAFYELIFYKDSDDIDFPDEIQEVKIVDLPPGTWEIVCTSKEATPLQASEIVEHCWVENTNGDEQMNCLGGNGVWFNDPLIALRSLLASNGCDLKNNYLILKKTA